MELCKGSSADFNFVCEGSNLSSSTIFYNFKNQDYMGAWVNIKLNKTVDQV